MFYISKPSFFKILRIENERWTPLVFQYIVDRNEHMMKIIEDDKDDDEHSFGDYHCDYERSSSESDYYDGYDNNVG